MLRLKRRLQHLPCPELAILVDKQTRHIVRRRPAHRQTADRVGDTVEPAKVKARHGAQDGIDQPGSRSFFEGIRQRNALADGGVRRHAAHIQELISTAAQNGADLGVQPVERLGAQVGQNKIKRAQAGHGAVDQRRAEGSVALILYPRQLLLERQIGKAVPLYAHEAAGGCVAHLIHQSSRSPFFRRRPARNSLPVISREPCGLTRTSSTAPPLAETQSGAVDSTVP